MAVSADFADDLDVQRLFAETVVAFGCVDVVVHTVDGRIASTSVADVNLDSSMRCADSTRERR